MEAHGPEQPHPMKQPLKKKLQTKEWQAQPRKPRRTTSKRDRRAEEKER